MLALTPSGGGAAALRDQYEAWRRAIVQAEPDLLLGIGVVIGRGLTAWVRTSLAAHTPIPVSTAAPCRRSMVPEELQTDLLHV